MNKNILALSVAAAALASSASAAVSSNIVGYVKLNIVKGYNLVVNPLNNTNPNGNLVSTLFGSTIKDVNVLQWVQGTGFVTTSFAEDEGNGVLTGGVDFALAPGQSVFVQNLSAADVSVTTVGDALVGTQTVAIVAGNNFVGSKIAIAGTATELGLTPTGDAKVLTWDVPTQEYKSFDYVGPDGTDPGVWLSEPSVTVGQGIVVQTLTPFSWTKTFTVN